MAIPDLRRAWTPDDLLDLPDDGNRYEIVDGELRVSPSYWRVEIEPAVRLVVHELRDGRYVEVTAGPIVTVRRPVEVEFVLT